MNKAKLLRLCMYPADQQHTARSCAAYARANDVAVIVEPASNNARRLYARVDIAAPVRIVWDSLTDYDGLGNFIPGGLSASAAFHRQASRSYQGWLDMTMS